MTQCIRCSNPTNHPKSTYCRECSDDIADEGERSREGITSRQRWRGYPTIKCPGRRS